MMDKNNDNIKIGDYLFWFTGDSSSKRYKQDDRYYISKYQIMNIISNPTDFEKLYTLTVKRINNDEVIRSIPRHWYADIAKDYAIQKL
ncbi:hypothetical protein [Ruminococcus sp. YE282]|uniref:hypothetical protein n=1 Tax=Ruminococcus sp. YE282 TaxID=3158780 RepID=UPI00115FC08A